MFTCVLCGKTDTTIPYKCYGCHGDYCYRCSKHTMPQNHNKCQYCTTYDDRKKYNRHDFHDLTSVFNYKHQ